MRKPAILMMIMAALAFSSGAFAQNIGISLDESEIQSWIDGRFELVPNPELGNLPSVVVYLIAFDISELFGYEYRITSSDATAIVGTPTFYPTATSANFGTGGDVRVGTGACFHAGDLDAGPVPTQIRLARHIYSWFAPPSVDVVYCMGPISQGDYAAPNYTECVPNPVLLPLASRTSISNPAYPMLVFSSSLSGSTANLRIAR